MGTGLSLGDRGWGVGMCHGLEAGCGGGRLKDGALGRRTG